MVRKQKTKEKFPEGIVTIKATFNNTHITFTDLSGNVLSKSSAGKVGFKGSKKSSPFAAQQASEEAAREARDKYEVRRVSVRLRGPGSGRDSAIRGISSAGISITSLEDVTPLPHNGCRPPKKRRV